MFAVRKARMSN